MPLFVDTNVFVYGRDGREVDKQARALDWLDRLWRERTGRVSFQVLSEYYVTVTRKLDPGLDVEQARQDVRDLAAWRPVAVDSAVLDGAWQVESRYGLSLWDAQIVSAAIASRCTHLLSEDMTAGADYGGVEVVDPFAVAPGDLGG